MVAFQVVHMMRRDDATREARFARVQAFFAILSKAQVFYFHKRKPILKLIRNVVH